MFLLSFSRGYFRVYPVWFSFGALVFLIPCQSLSAVEPFMPAFTVLKTPQIIFGTSSPFGHPTSSSLADLAVPPLVRVEAFIGVGLNDIY